MPLPAYRFSRPTNDYDKSLTQSLLTSDVIDRLHDSCTDPAPVLLTDPDLARVFAAWPTLPAAIRQAVLAVVGTAADSGR